ncbi:HDOD domain-containing protein [Rhodoferax sp. 4810]|nr:HDOD domain-containing protein [Rhodoferax jenense]
MIDAELFAFLQTHKQEGFCIALDSRHVLTQPDYAVRIADFIKVDVLHDDPAQLRGQLIEKMPKCNHALIATKVETADTYHLCQGLGFNYFQGFYLSFPNVIAGQRLEGNKLALIKLLDLLQQPQSTTEEMTRLVSSDAALSLEMLKLINSPRFRRPQPIESVRQAVLLLGRSEIRRLTLLLSLRNLATGPMSMEQTLIRARMAAHLAPILNRADEAERFFTLGLLSTIDRLFGIPIVEIVRKMRLTSEIREALLDRNGPLAIVIDILDAFEQPDIPLPDDLAVTPEILGQLYFTSVSEAHSDLAHLTDEPIE